ncbi:MAG: TIGR03364 family FAD-dependent oxidoreductase [Phyllobacterium sp.]
MAVYDLAVVGAGIVGLAHAYVAAKRGKRVIVIDRDARANGASIRNFGFVTITGQTAGDCWTKARRSREIWSDIAPAAGIGILQRGMVLAARFGEAETVIDAFLNTEMGEGCSRMTTAEALTLVPSLRAEAAGLALYSPHEIRVESRTAIPRLTGFLTEKLGVTFYWKTNVRAVLPPRVETSQGDIEAETVIICPGDEYTGLFSDRLAAYGLTRCKLQMLRVRPGKPLNLAATVMSELSLARSGGYAGLPGIDALRKQLDDEMAEHRRNDVHLIVAQSEDGSLVVGDSHHYASTPDPFGSRHVDDLILSELNRVMDLPQQMVSESWIGTYASAPDRWRLTDEPCDGVRIVVVTSGCGASTSFAIAEETISSLFS